MNHTLTNARRLVGALGATLLLGASVTGCYESAEYVYGERFEGRLFQIYDGTEGIHPSQSVLDDPLNPFQQALPAGEDKWDIEGSSASPVLKFYAWASTLSIQPTGENQFYTGLALQAIYDQGLATNEELPMVRDMAVAAFQSVLDNFPDAVTYDATGTFSYGLATPAYNALVGLGGPVEGGWILVETPNGPTAVQQ